MDLLTWRHKQLASEYERLRDELEGAQKEGQLCEDTEAGVRLEEAVWQEKARFSGASKKIEAQKEELSEKTLALQKSLMADNHYRTSFKDEKQRLERPAADSLAVLGSQLRDPDGHSKPLMCDMQTLTMEHADIRQKLTAAEAEFDLLTSTHHSHPECQDEMLDYEQTFSECQSTIGAQRSESEARRAELRRPEPGKGEKL